jgi:hypothetical protein
MNPGETHQIGVDAVPWTQADYKAAGQKQCPVHGGHKAVQCGSGMDTFRAERLEKEAFRAELNAAIVEMRDSREQADDRFARIETTLNRLMTEGGPGRGNVGEEV